MKGPPTLLLIMSAAFHLSAADTATRNALDQAAADAAGSERKGFTLNFAPLAVWETLPAPPKVEPLPDPGEPVLRIDCGTTNPPAGWLPEQERTHGAAYGFVGGNAGTRGDLLRTTGPLPPAVYRSEHYDMTAWEFDLPNGAYTVRLHFMESFEGVYKPGMFAREINATVVPGAGAFAGTWDSQRSGPLPDGFIARGADGVHFSVHRAYLNKCLFWIAFIGETPAGRMPPTLVGSDLPIDPAIAAWIEAYAWDYYGSYARQHGIKLGLLKHSP